MPQLAFSPSRLPPGRVKYARIRAGSVQLQYLLSSPKKFVQLLGNLKSYGNIQSFVLDVCPHCMTFPRLNTNSMLAPADVLQIWATSALSRSYHTSPA